MTQQAAPQPPMVLRSAPVPEPAPAPSAEAASNLTSYARVAVSEDGETRVVLAGAVNGVAAVDA